jgi:hypothetical protein
LVHAQADRLGQPGLQQGEGLAECGVIALE